MRIVFLCTSSLDDPSPRGRWLPLAQELGRQGHEVHLLLLHPTYDQLTLRCFQQDDVHVAYVGQMHVYGYPGQRRYFGPVRLWSTAFRSAVALAAYAVRLHPDVLHVAKPQPINGLAGLLARRSGAKLYIDCDDYEAEANRFYGLWQRWIVRWWEDRLPLMARAVSVNTRFLYNRYKGLGVAPERLFYIPNGAGAWQCQCPSEADVQALRAKLELVDRPTVIYVGTMSTIAHSVMLLLESFALLLKRLPEARLLMVGDGDDRPMLQRRAQELGIGPALLWTGRVPSKQVPTYLALADCSVDPVHDTLAARARSPLKIVESLAASVPVVTGDVGDRREMLGEGSAGLLVQPGDARALADGMWKVLSDPSLRMALAHGTRQQAAIYRWDRLVCCWKNIYQL